MCVYINVFFIGIASFHYNIVFLFVIILLAWLCFIFAGLLPFKVLIFSSLLIVVLMY